MKLHSITLKNYRLFPEFECSLHPDLTVFVADNGGGKTSILDAVRVVFDTYLGAFPTGRGKGIKLTDVRQVKAKGEFFQMEPAFPVEVHATGQLFESAEPITWARTLNTAKSATTVKDARALAAFGTQLLRTESGGLGTANWPLLAYYGTGRLWHQKKLTSGKVFAAGFHTRSAAYIDCMEPASSYKAFVDWFGYAYRSITQAKILFMEANPLATPQEVNAQESGYSPLVAGIQEAVDIMLKPSGWGQLWYSETEQDITAVHAELGRLAVGQLSDGIRNSIALVADIAYRAVQLNPHLGARAVKETTGVVLIDEVDMHLHPSWQQVVLANLREAFPRIQFIVTTHSPQVLSTVRSENIRIVKLTDSGYVAAIPDFSPLAHESGDALAKVMGTHKQPPLPILEIVREFEQMVRANMENSVGAKGLRQQLDDAGYQIHESDLATWRFLASRRLAREA
jgi:predicted ATP-binding protein involved in virulence